MPTSSSTGQFSQKVVHFSGLRTERTSPGTRTQNLRSLRNPFAWIRSCSKHPVVTGFFVHRRSLASAAWLLNWLSGMSCCCLNVRSSVLAQVLAEVREGEVDVAVADGLDELRGQEPEAVLAGVADVHTDPVLDVGHL
jgi:hypothetical protein